MGGAGFFLRGQGKLQSASMARADSAIVIRRSRFMRSSASSRNARARRFMTASWVWNAPGGLTCLTSSS